jgi:hypothetical protein
MVRQAESKFQGEARFLLTRIFWQGSGKKNWKSSSSGELLYRLIIAALTLRVSVLYLPIMLTNENDLRRRWDI